MANLIKKYNVEFRHFDEVFLINMPHNADVLDVQVQGGLPMLWALVNEKAANVPCRVVVFGTGSKIPEQVTKRDFIATWQIESFVYHLFRAPL